MSRIVPITMDPRPVPVQKERRTYEIRIITEKGLPYLVVAYREEILQDAQGNPVDAARRDFQVRRELTPAFFAAHPTIAPVVQEIADLVDTWDAEDNPIF